MENKTDNTKNVHESSFFKRFLNKAEDYVKQPLRIKELLNDAYQKASEKKDFGTIAGEVFESLATLSRMIKAAVSGEYQGIPTSTVVMGVAVIIYFLSPIDLIPDWLPVIGLIDDVSLLAWFMTSIKSEMEKFHAWEETQQVKTAAPANSSDQATAMNVDTSGQTTKYENEPAGQYSATHITGPSSSGIGSSAQQQNTSLGEGKPHEGNDSSGSQGSGGTIITTPTEIPIQEINPTATHDAEPTEHGVPTGYGEPNVRASTTDGTRVPSSNSYDTDHGGNVR